MALSIKENRRLPFRLLLLMGYFFLFATQLNYKYYSIANFFVYGNGTISAARHPLSSVQQQKSEHPPVYTIYRKAPQKAAHLGVDKRFHGVGALKVGDVFFEPVLSCREIERSYGVLLQVYSSSDLPTNSLRGPPAA